MVGQTLAHYKILEKIGSGGMGDVYLAEDTKLDRKVALKVLPPELAESEERRARFQREAKAIAALDHPNIVQVFSVEEADGIHFITMQLVHGKTLTELLPKNGFSLTKFFDITIPLADAVAAAHQEGITHRDLKPDNMMVGEDGRVKVLDFGLAKPTSGFVGGDANSALPTAAKTAEGVIVGTLNYMSPEQAEGKSVDHRADLFSIGIILYEMATGQRPFRGNTTASLLSSIIKDTPTSVTEVNPDIPRELGKIIRRCLAKDPERRFQNAKDLRNDLEELKTEWSSGELEGAASVARPPATAKWLAAIAVLLTILIVGGALYTLRSPNVSVPRLVNATQLTSSVGREAYPTWSPDGGRLAYESDRSGNRDIWVVQVDGGAPVNRTADSEGDEWYPSWSPDGSRIAYWSRRNDGWSLSTMPAVGGSPRSLMAVGLPSGPPQWLADGTEIAVSMRDPEEDRNYAEIIFIETLETRRVSLPDYRNYRLHFLVWSPDGRAYAYVGGSWAQDTHQLMVVAEDGAPIPVTDGFSDVWSPSWSADGTRLFFVSNRVGGMDLWQQRVSDGIPDGEPERVTTGVGMSSASFSPDGTKLAYSRGPRQTYAHIFRAPVLDGRPATWSDAEQITFDSAYIQFLDVSPDGTRIVMSSDRAGNLDLWVAPADGGELTQLTTDRAPDWAPRWSPDGEQIVFYSYRSGDREIWTMPAGGGPARQVTENPGEDAVPTWSSDSRQIAFTSRRSGSRTIWAVAVEGGEPRRLTTEPSAGYMPAYSPDGKWLVGSSGNGDGPLWRTPAEGGEHALISRAGAATPRFAPDSRTIFFPGWLERRGNVWALSLDDGREYPVTDLEGRRGNMGWGLATDGDYVYFLWNETVGDIWVMDVVTEDQ